MIERSAHASLLYFLAQVLQISRAQVEICRTSAPELSVDLSAFKVHLIDFSGFKVWDLVAILAVGA